MIAGLAAVFLVGVVTAPLPPSDTASAASAGCAANAGAAIVLASDSADPQAFVFDSRARLADYVDGRWNDAHAILVHTLLAEPGTRALVVACYAGATHPRFGTATGDALGVKLVSGTYRGRFGWVTSSDAHPAPPLPLPRAARRPRRR